MAVSPITTQLVVTLQPGDDAQVLTAKIDQLVTDYRKTVQSPPQEQKIGGWTQTTMDQFLAALLSEGREVYVDIIREAARRGGAIPRHRVMARLGRTSDARLNGFTRPVKGAMNGLIRVGNLPMEADQLLEPQYDGGFAETFTIPARIVPFILNSPFLAHWDESQK